MKQIINIQLSRLIGHEQIDNEKLRSLLDDLKRTKILHKPVVIDQNTMTILDGHHRCQAFKVLGISKIPCLMVDYFSDEIKVNFRRPEIKNRLIKEIIINTAKRGRLFPHKTTKHKIPNRININTPIQD